MTARGVGVVLAALLLSACAPPPSPPAARDGLVVGIVGDPASLLEDDPVGSVVGAMVTEPLVRRTPTEDLEPRLVVSVPSYANGDLRVVQDASAPTGRLVATFRLRGGLRWQDGAPITSDDVRFAFDQDRNAPPGSAERVRADRMERVDVVDQRTFRVVYRAGERWDQFALGPRALPRHLLDGASPAVRAQYAARPIHAGPYRIVDRTPGTIVLEAFADHVGGPPPIERVVVRSFSDRSALLAALRSGEVDVVPYPGFDADLYATLDRTFGGKNEQVLYTPAQAVAMLRFGGRVADPAVRRAISLTVDRARIARSVFGGRARVPDSYLVAPLWAATDVIASPRVDVAAAKDLLAGAGFRPGNFGIEQRGDDRLIVSLLVPPSPALEEAARGVAVDLATIGIAADVTQLSAAEVDRRVGAGDYDLAIVLETADDPLVATDRYRGQVSAWFDVLAQAARDADGRADKKLLYLECQRLWSDAAVALPLYQALKVDVVPARLQGVRPASHGAPITWNVGEWRIA
ncbi:MAG: hypothetical protein KGK34_06590 [Chloroflexota bacterium]|nr:hypothetical protein [Chloroflexota bacterium]